MIKSIFQHLRIPFSILLLPVYLFAYFEAMEPNIFDAALLFLILHLFVYPSSNAFNSLQDEDEGSIGLIKKPMPVPQELNLITIVLDLLAIGLSFLINHWVAIGVLIYILFSRLYSYRPIRLKKYPVLGFLTVFVFQGSWIFLLTSYALNTNFTWTLILNGICASCLIGAVYPLSQIYQHQQDIKDGVRSISYILGYRGTFLFSGSLFIIGTSIFLLNHWLQPSFNLIFLLCQFPVVVYFIFWFYKVWKNIEDASYERTMLMNIIASICMNSCFIILNFYKR